MASEVDPKLRRFLLEPLSRRQKKLLDETSYLQALRRLDDRAVGEDILQQLREVTSFVPSLERSDRWKDPAEVARHVTLAKALYASGQILKHEYVVFAVFPVESMQDLLLFDGQYDEELGPIIQSMEKIEKEYDLGPDEYLHLSDAPKEYIVLDQQYKDILDKKFQESLRKFGLDDLVDLKQKSPKEYERLRERGRRAVFHKEEYIPALKDSVLQYEKEAHISASVRAYAAAITALGAGVEGLLLLRCLRSPHKASRISKGLPKRVRPRAPNDPSTWSFETLIEVCLEAGWLPPIQTSIARYNTAALAHVLRRMRNYVHPGKRAKERPWSDTDEREYRDAEAIYRVLISSLGHRRRSRRGNNAKH